MKVIFLDIDGVLNVNYPHRDEFGSIFHPEFVENLRDIIEKTQSKIVISSSWRHNGLTEMKEMWVKRNLPGEVIDITPIFKDKKKLPFFERLERGNEIQMWLDKHEVDNYVIIDDDNDMMEHQLEHFVMTSENKSHPDCIDIGYGLTKKCTEKVIKILNG